jgi:hypothetical protein
MKKGGLIVGALVAGGVVFAMRGCLSKADPDERLAGRFDKMCAIAKANIETPERGVKKLGAYLGDHLGDVTGEFGETIAMIEKIRDDDKHDNRARVARDRIFDSVAKCADTWVEFFEAVDNDPEASHTMQVAGERLSRTLEILFGGESLKKLDLPAFQHELDLRLR